MSLTIRIELALLAFLIGTFIVTWAIREGGSFALLHPSRWRKRPAGTTPGHEDRRP
jgi:hypothetical protein